MLSSSVQAVSLCENTLILLDQRKLPNQVQYVSTKQVNETADAIRDMIVRGAPAIGITAAYGMVLSARQHLISNPTENAENALKGLHFDAKALRETRPTAVNLMWALDRMLACIETSLTASNVASQWGDAIRQQCFETIRDEAIAIHQEDINACKTLGDYGATLMPSGATILTHCNAGALATGGYGTALGVIRSAFSADNNITVFASETRPRLQGALLTTWELTQDNIPTTLISDNMAASLMAQNKIQAVVVGADRIARNGDTANKIGTYMHALAAQAHQIPFYIAAPLSTIDMACPSGTSIPIEQRSHDEILSAYPAGYDVPVQFTNPAFDVTPASLISGIITEYGVAPAGHFEPTFKQWFLNQANNGSPIPA